MRVVLLLYVMDVVFLAAFYATRNSLNKRKDQSETHFDRMIGAFDVMSFGSAFGYTFALTFLAIMQLVVTPPYLWARMAEVVDVGLSSQFPFGMIMMSLFFVCLFAMGYSGGPLRTELQASTAAWRTLVVLVSAIVFAGVVGVVTGLFI